MQLQLQKAGAQALLVVQASRKNADDVLMSIPAVVAVDAAAGWDFSSVQKAVQDVLAPGLTAARLGLQWREVSEAGGKILYLSSDAGLLTSVLQARNPPLSQPVSYAAAFSHSRERQNFYKFTSLIDQQSAEREAEPQFFSHNMASFSRTFKKLESEEIITHKTKDRIQQTVTYRWMP